MTHAPPIFCALDRPDLEGALALGRSLAGRGRRPQGRARVRHGERAGRRAQGGRPRAAGVPRRQVPRHPQHRGRAVRAARALGVAMLNLHIAGGPAMLRAAVEAARRPRATPRLLGVTVLTSVDDRDLAALGVAGQGGRASAPPGGAGPGHRLGRRRSAAARRSPPCAAAAAPASSSWCRASGRPEQRWSTIRSG